MNDLLNKVITLVKADPKQAHALLDAALPSAASDPHLWIARAYVRRFEGDSRGAEAEMTRAIELNHAEPDYFFTRGRYRLELNELAGAVDDFSAAINLSVQANWGYYLEPSHLARAEAYIRLGESRKAIDDCARVANDSMKWPGVRSRSEILEQCLR